MILKPNRDSYCKTVKLSKAQMFKRVYRLKEEVKTFMSLYRSGR